MNLISRVCRGISSFCTIEQEISTVEKWSLQHANRCSPEDIIVAAVIQSFAKNPEDWKLTGKLSWDWMRTWRVHPPTTATLSNAKKDITIVFYLTETAVHNGDFQTLKQTKGKATSCTIQGLMLPKSSFIAVLRAWEGVSSKVKAVKAAAAKAKADMERNEKAWDIAESLLNMKRNEFGALVPKEIVDVL